MNTELLLLVSAILVQAGAFGAVSGRSAVKVLISLEVMFNGVLLAVLTLAIGAPEAASSLAILAISLSSVEVGVLISIFVLLFRRIKSVDVYQVPGLRGEKVE